MTKIYYLYGLFVFIVLVNSSLQAGKDCSNVVCPPSSNIQESCQYPKDILYLPDPLNSCCNKTECICVGTTNGLSTASQQVHTERLVKRYSNCTIVDGNLEIVQISDSIAVPAEVINDALKDIKEVTGYVLIGLNTMKTIKLPKLRLIRGETYYMDLSSMWTCQPHIEKPNAERYSLVITGNHDGASGLREVQMPVLTEILKGSVKIALNHFLCHLDTIMWKEEILRYPKIQTVTVSQNGKQADPPCGTCASECKGTCWTPTVCQSFSRVPCNETCSNRCDLNKKCCSEACAAGCMDITKASGSRDRSCYACRNINNYGSCVNECPKQRPGLVSTVISKVEEAERPYELSRFCVSECPISRRELLGKFCVSTCPEKYYDKNGKCHICEDGECDHICHGLDTGIGPLRYDSEINAFNIGNFTKNCTIIEGSLIFREVLFTGYINTAGYVMKAKSNGTGKVIFMPGKKMTKYLILKDDHCRVPPITDPSALDVFQSVREITGYLSIEFWKFSDLCIFKNLKTIRGLESQQNTYSLMVSTHGDNLRELCFNSLTQVMTGDILINGNRLLCHTDEVNWSLLTNSTIKNKDNLSKSRCRNVYIQDNKQLCYVKSINLKKLFTTKEQRGQKKKNNRTCSKCNENCFQRDGCWGSGNDQCLTCLNFTDYTNDNGKFTDKWVLDPATGKNIPGYNVTRCVPECDTLKRVYATENKECFPCHEECHFCNGSSSADCIIHESNLTHGCRNANLEGTCVSVCPETYYMDEDRYCQKCDENCMGETSEGETSICKGPDASYSETGCSFCYFQNDTEEEILLYIGLRCPLCDNCAEGCTLLYGQDKEEKKCIERKVITVGMIVGIAVGIVLIAAVLCYCFYRHRKTIRKMRKHIGDNLLNEREPYEDINTPLTPSGAAPNQAQLRIVKENELTMGKELGSGAFGAVYKALWTPMHIANEKVQITVAVKKLKTVSHSNEIMDEAYVMASVDSPYLVRLLGICMTEHVSLITQLMPLGSLLEYVKTHKTEIGSKDMLSWCVQIAKGMLYLEEKHLVHRDLAARNVLLKTPRHAKITDFGLAKMLSADQHEYFAEGGKLPIKWLALECITERKFSHQSDVWAFGVTCWEIYTYGQRPYEGVRAVDVFSLLGRGDRLPQPHVTTIDVYMLLIKCWMVDPLSRPRFSELVEEFTKMLHDPSRFLVIEGDPGNVLSPKPYDEKMFFRKLLEEDELAGNVEDPDEYLLSNNIEGHPEYANQEILAQQYQSSSINNGPGTSVHPSFRNDRLFSRNTSSAYGDRPSTTHDSRMSEPLSRTTSHVSGNSSAGDDVFANDKSGRCGNIPEMPNEESNAACYPPNHDLRIDSEETSRYTDDPTVHKQLPVHDAEMTYDEDQYLLPTPNLKIPDYFDPSSEEPSKDEEDTLLKQPSTSMMNSTYIDTSQDSPQFNKRRNLNYKTSDVSTGSQRPLLGSPDSEYVNTNNDEHEYLNDFKPAKLSPRIHSMNGRRPEPSIQEGSCFSNEEYMATDSGIGDGEEPRLSMSRKRDHSLSSSGDGSSNASDSISRRNQPEYVNSSEANPQNFSNVLSNPEYMMLHE